MHMHTLKIYADKVNVLNWSKEHEISLWSNMTRTFIRAKDKHKKGIMWARGEI